MDAWDEIGDPPVVHVLNIAVPDAAAVEDTGDEEEAEVRELDVRPPDMNRRLRDGFNMLGWS